MAGLSVSAFGQSALPADGGHFSVMQGGKQLGEARFTTAPVPGGLELRSSGGMKLNSFSYSFNNTTTLDAGANPVRDELTGSVHGAKVSGNNIRFTTAADATGRQFGITVDADGKQTTNTVDRRQNMVLLPDLDPAGYTMMARIAAKQPPTAWALIPKENGIVAPVRYTAEADLRGTLNGQPVAVKHTVAAVGEENAVVVELFASPAGDLLETDLNGQNLQVVRDGFRLEDRPKPVAPPAGQAPPPDSSQGADPNSPLPQ